MTDDRVLKSPAFHHLCTMGRRPPLTISCSNDNYRIAILEEQLQRTIAALNQKRKALEREQCYLIIESQQLLIAEQKLLTGCWRTDMPTRT